MKLSVRSLLFDYGGTIDTNGVHWGEALWEMYGLYHKGLSREVYGKAYVQVEQQLGRQSIIQPNHTFKETLAIKVSLQLEILGIGSSGLVDQITEASYENTRQCVHRASKVLSQLKEYYPMHLVSNFYGNLQTVLREFELTDFFKTVTESAEVGYRKPDPEIYKIAIEKTGCRPEEIVVIGDSYKNDIQPAEKIGCQSIWLKVKGWNNEVMPIHHPLIIKDFSNLITIVPFGTEYCYHEDYKSCFTQHRNTNPMWRW